jgi:cell division protein FtsB
VRRIMFVAIGLTLAIIVANGVAGDRGLIQTVRMRHERQQLADAIARFQEENRRLALQAARLRDDPAAIEEIARGELGLIRPGEHLFIVTDRPVPGP